MIKELDQEHSNDTLQKWVVHYLAELIVSAEESDDVAQKEKCAETILKIWEMRKDLPLRDNSILGIGDVLTTIQRLLDPAPLWDSLGYGDSGLDKSIWDAYFRTIMPLQKQFLRISALLSLLNIGLARELKWKEDAEAFLSEEEREAINLLAFWLEGGSTIPAITFTIDEETSQKEKEFKDYASKAKVEKIFEVLSDNLRDQISTLESLKETLLKSN